MASAATALHPAQCRTLGERRTVRHQRKLVVRAQVERPGVAQQNGAAVLEKEEERVPSPSVNVIQPISR